MKHNRLSSRFTSHEKTDAVLRLLKGESVEIVSDELGISAERVERWKKNFIAAGSAELAKRKSASSRRWNFQGSRTVWQWIWLLLALIIVVSVAVLLMQRTAQE